MKKIIIGSVIGVAVFAAILVCVFLFLEKSNVDSETNYNYSGNIANAGIATENDEFVFLSPSSGKEIGIFKKSKEDGSVTKICDDSAMDLNIYNKHLYYINTSDEGKIYKIDFDGGNREKVSDDFTDCEYLFINNNKGFFEYSENGNIYKPYVFENDFENVRKINDDDVEFLINDNDFVYYSNWGDNGKIYKVKLDGSEKTSLNSTYSEFINISDDWIYYVNVDDNRKIYRMKKDGRENSVFCEDSCSYVNYYDGFIYYSNESDENKIYRINTESKEKNKIYDFYGLFISIADNRVYFIRQDDGNLYSMNLDGSECNQVIE